MAASMRRDSPWLALVLLTAISTVGFIDRIVMNVLAVPIQAEFGLSDTQVGLLTGLAFAVLNVALGIVVARYAERGRRLFLFFEGVGAFATAWVNSKSAGQHAGGRTAFTLDVTGFGSARFSYPPPDFWRTESNKDACEDSPLSAPLRARPPTSAPPLPTRLAFPAP